MTQIEVEADGGPDTDAWIPAPLAEDLHVPERVIVAPTGGIFHPAAPGVATSEGEIVHHGQTVGTIHRNGGSEPVVSAHSGFLMGMLVLEGERVRSDQPIAWVRTF